MGESEVLRTVFSVVQTFAGQYPEVADFFGALVAGEAAPRERVAALLPRRGASRAAAEALEFADTDPFAPTKSKR